MDIGLWSRSGEPSPLGIRILLSLGLSFTSKISGLSTPYTGRHMRTLGIDWVCSARICSHHAKQSVIVCRATPLIWVGVDHHLLPPHWDFLLFPAPALQLALTKAWLVLQGGICPVSPELKQTSREARCELALWDLEPWTLPTTPLPTLDCENILGHVHFLVGSLHSKSGAGTDDDAATPGPSASDIADLGEHGRAYGLRTDTGQDPPC